MKTMSMLVAYDGAPFCGFARQPGQLTVQGELEHALELLMRREVLTVCAGRTDAGVHALGQCVSFELEDEELEDRNLEKMQRSLNALTHEGISVRDLQVAPDGFSARFDAKWREYRYRIVLGQVPPVFLASTAWWPRVEKLDLEAMEQAAAYLIGEHDFKSFCLAISAIDKPTCRNVMSIDFLQEEQMGESCLTIRVVGNAFLHSMVRTIVGSLMEVGTGRRDPEWMQQALEACDRKAAGPCAPACGLTFWHVEY